MLPEKRIILLLDGTWNDPESSRSDTNIVRLRELIASNLQPLSDSRADSEPTASPLFYSLDKKSWRKHVVFYERGVGTGGFFDNIRGGGFGAGLARNIRRAYNFLSRHYSVGDQVFIFGFSRGAFTARSLAGYIGAAGLLKNDCYTPVLESKSWYYYRLDPKDRTRSVWNELQPNMHSSFDIECLAVFDTVGALGVPIHYFWRENRDLFGFHDVEVSSITNRNLHALAVDEHRDSFRPSVWRTPKFHTVNSHTEQVWFPGCHADVGGGYIDEAARQKHYPYALDDVSLDWMLKRLAKYYPDFPTIRQTTERQLGQLWSAQAPQHESRKGAYRLTPKAWRSIANQVVTCRGFNVNVCYDRHARALHERLHISVLERVGCKVRVNRFLRRVYKPKNVKGLLDTIEVGYMRQESDVLVVNWDSEILDPKSPADCDVVLNTVSAAKRRLGIMSE
jgi:uncharacterized protein (DUF2235 family)